MRTQSGVHVDERAIINERIRQAGFSVMELAKRADIARPNLARYLDGTKELRTDSLRKLLTVLGLTIKADRGRPGRNIRRSDG